MTKKKSSQIEDASIVEEPQNVDNIVCPASEEPAQVATVQEPNEETDASLEVLKDPELTEEQKKVLEHNRVLRGLVYFASRIYGRANLWAVKHYAEERNMTLIEIKAEIEDKASRLSANARRLVLDVDTQMLAEALEIKSGLDVVVDDSSLEVEADASLEA